MAGLRRQAGEDARRPGAGRVEEHGLAVVHAVNFVAGGAATCSAGVGRPHARFPPPRLWPESAADNQLQTSALLRSQWSRAALAPQH